MHAPSPRRIHAFPRRLASLRAPAPLLTAAAVACSLAAASFSAHATELAVTVDQVRSADGALLVSVVRGERGFDGADEPVAQLMVQPVVPAARFTLDLPPGTYGIRMFHDLDGDGDLETNLVGLPSEPWAFSNNAVGTFGPPKWGAVRFEVGADPVAQSIRLNH